MLFQKVIWNQPTEAFQIQETKQETLIHNKPVSPLVVKKTTEEGNVNWLFLNKVSRIH